MKKFSLNMHREFIVLSFIQMTMSLETLQSYFASETTTTTTTKAPWPKLELEPFSASPTDPWKFVPHRKPTMGPQNTEGTLKTTTAQPLLQNRKTIRVFSEDMLPLSAMQTPTSAYKRHEVPTSVRRISSVKTTEQAIKTQKTRRKGGSGIPKEVLVSIPKIFADMALTGHFGKITIPRNRIR